MSGKYDVAASVLAEEINRREAELGSLRAAYERLGGTYEEDDAAEAPKLLAGPRQAARESDDFGVTLNSVFVKLSERQAQVVEMLMAANGAVVDIDDFAGLYGGVKGRWYAECGQINAKLAAANAAIVNQRGLGYRLEKIR